MVTTQTFKVVRGAAEIDLASGAYMPMNLTIPAIAHTAVIATGSSSNITGGGVKVADKFNDRVWSFDLRILGTTDADIRSAVRRVSDFLYSLSDTTPTYFEYRANSDTPEPLWGVYGSALRFEVVNTVDVHLWEKYTADKLHTITTILSITVEIKPFAVGKEQRVCTATGGIYEDMFGSSDGLSTGTVIPEITTNKITNPVFSNTTAWNHDWTAGASVTATQNTDPQWLIYGTINSAKLTANGVVDDTFRISIAAGNTNKHSLSCFARLPNGGSISATQIQLVYNVTLTTTYQSLGNGWYRLSSENFNGIAGATNTGVIVADGYTVYVTGFQLEENAHTTAACWGDLPGHSWTGTAHDSTSTRPMTFCDVPLSSSVLNADRGSIMCVVRFDTANTINAPFVIWCADVSAGNWYLSYESSTDKITFNNTDTLTSTALTFSPGAVYHIAVTWDRSGIALYVNGVSVDTGTFTIPPLTTNLFIGTLNTGTYNLVGAFKLFSTFDVALTSTQIANDYANLSPMISSGSKIDSIPWFWTDDGDGILGLNTGKLPFGVASGIPGSMPAITEIRGTTSSDFATVGGILLNCFSTNIPIPSYLLILDSSGTVLAGDYGGQHRNTAAVDNTTKWQISTSTSGGPTVSSLYIKELNRKSAIYLIRIKAASAVALNIYASVISHSAYSDARLITTNTAYRIARTKQISLDFLSETYTDLPISGVTYGGVYATTLTGSLSVDVDYTAILLDDVLLLSPSGTGTSFVVRENDMRYATATTTANPIPSIGNIIHFVPGKYNHLQVYTGTDEGVNPLTTYTTTIGAIYVTPRWALL